MPLLSRRLAKLGTEGAFRVVPLIHQAEKQLGRRVIRCNIGEPDFPTPQHVVDELKRQLDAGNTKYTDPQGILPLRQAVARHFERRGVPATPERVVIFAGTKPSIGLAEHAYVDEGDEVIYPSPGFPIYESFLPYLGAKPVPLHLREERGFAFTGKDLEGLITPRTKLVILNFPSNPTGGVPDRALLEEIAGVLRKRLPQDARVFSDEIYEEIVFDGQEHVSIASLPGMAERTIVASGVSKSYAWTGGRVGWAVFPTDAEAQAFRNLNINYFSCVSGANQEAARVALESPLTAPAVRKMVDAFQARRDFVVDALNRIDGIRCTKPRGSFYAFPNVGGVCERFGANSRELQMFLLFRHGLATLDRNSFGTIGAEGQHYLRISVATSMDDLQEGMRLLAAAATDVEGFTNYNREDAKNAKGR